MTHVLHTVKPLSLPNCPTKQSKHWLEPCCDKKVPRPHNSHDVLASELVKDPTWHNEQAEEFPDENVPTEHASHTVTPPPE